MDDVEQVSCLSDSVSEEIWSRKKCKTVSFTHIKLKFLMIYLHVYFSHLWYLLISCLNRETSGQLPGFIIVLLSVSRRSLFTGWEELKRTNWGLTTFPCWASESWLKFKLVFQVKEVLFEPGKVSNCTLFSRHVQGKLCLHLTSQQGSHHVLRCVPAIRKLADRQNWTKTTGVRCYCSKAFTSSKVPAPRLLRSSWLT